MSVASMVTKTQFRNDARYVRDLKRIKAEREEARVFSGENDLYEHRSDRTYSAKMTLTRVENFPGIDVPDLEMNVSYPEGGVCVGFEAPLKLRAYRVSGNGDLKRINLAGYVVEIEMKRTESNKKFYSTNWTYGKVALENNKGAEVTGVLMDPLRSSHIDETVEKKILRLLSDKRVFVKFSVSTKRIEGEYNQLKKVHEVLPDNTPEPLGLIKNREGKLIGHYMTRIEGVDLSDMGDMTKDQIDYLRRLVAELHSHGVAHNDLTSGNIIIRPDGSLALLDPSPYNTLEEGMQCDKACLKGFSNALPFFKRLKRLTKY